MKQVHYPAIFAVLLLAGCALRTGGVSHDRADGADTIDDLGDMDSIRDGEVPETCGNGELEPPEECDDGNDAGGDGCENDCTFSCREHGDCRDGDICNGREQCGDDHACEGGVPLDDGVVCGDDPRSICLGHACVESRCGDGFVDEGGGEFCEPPGAGNCNPDCRLECDGNADCPDDLNPCNGNELCDLDAHLCDRTDPMTDGMTCNPDPRKICLGEVCQESLCGDGFVDSGRAPPEECEDMNVTDGDGCDNDCTFSCEYDWECDDDDVCNGEETCDEGSHVCDEGDDADEGTACDDELFCTVVDECDGDGECTGSGNPCDDEPSCVTVTCNEDANECSYGEVLPGHCLIDSVCFANGERNPENMCQECRSGENPDFWMRRPEMETCTNPSGTEDGVCCEGQCRLGGDCCGNPDCKSICAGRALPCESFRTGTECRAQAGCDWTAASTSLCGGSVSCGSIDADESEDCTDCGCGYDCPDDCTCTGASSARCSGFSGEESCDDCGCTWIESGDEHCSGEATACSEIARDVACYAQSNCAWDAMICTAYTCSSIME